jgi:hypothetical protein
MKTDQVSKSLVLAVAMVLAVASSVEAQERQRDPHQYLAAVLPGGWFTLVDDNGRHFFNLRARILNYRGSECVSTLEGENNSGEWTVRRIDWSRVTSAYVTRNGYPLPPTLDVNGGLTNRLGDPVNKVSIKPADTNVIQSVGNAAQLLFERCSQVGQF